MFSAFLFSFVKGYENLQMRKETRESAWQKPGWDEVVQYTGIMFNILLFLLPGKSGEKI
jgi:hypothetical protein